jgi:hypothetical protein
MTLVTRIVSLAALLPVVAVFASACAQPFRCGANGEYCCLDAANNPYCLDSAIIGDPPLTCDFASATCIPTGVAPPCGNAGQTCCGAGSCTGAGLVCTAGTCQTAPATCGNAAQPCCDGSCTGTLQCVGGSCQVPTACGNLDQACCGGASCNGTLTCMAGTCEMGPTGTACPGTTGPCDIGLQNCGSGQTCQLTIDGTTSCRSVGSGGNQASCSSDSQCAFGHYCSPFSGRCHPQCCGTAGCGADQVCIGVGTGTDAGLCFGSPCDPVTGGGCAPDYTCYVGGNPAGGLLTICTPPGTVAAGGACSALDECVPGHVCLGDPGTCVELCRPSSPFCSFGTCSALGDGDDLGVCQ